VVSTAEWSGVTLASILELAGLKKEAVDVVLEGADSGVLKNEPKPEGKLHFARGLPLAKALKPEVLLAYRMNGEALSVAHGYPLRAVVSGWYGMASVKWLSRIVVTNRPFHGYDQTTDYGIWERRDGLASLTPITSMEVKASIARPSASETIPAGAAYRLYGAAWAGESEVTKVEVSTDGGKTWAAARLIDEAKPFCWRRWEYNWDKPLAGKHRLLARATDKEGHRQPMERDPDRRNYMINHVVPVEIKVGG
jgi:DMSO/TMAO reductase YedYZ molybdopterin-dependent catalytic subunit